MKKVLFILVAIVFIGCSQADSGGDDDPSNNGDSNYTLKIIHDAEYPFAGIYNILIDGTTLGSVESFNEYLSVSLSEGEHTITGTYWYAHATNGSVPQSGTYTPYTFNLSINKNLYLFMFSISSVRQ